MRTSRSLPGALNWRRATAYCTAIVRATFDALMAAPRGVADVVLDRALVRRLENELASLRVVGGVGADRLDVGAVPGLRHGEAAGQLQAHDGRQEALVVLLGAEVQDRAAEQPPLH